MRVLIASLVTAWLGVLCDWMSTVRYTKIPGIHEMHPTYSPISAFIIFSLAIPVACFASPKEGKSKFWPLGLAAFPWLGYIYSEMHFSGVLFLALLILGVCGTPLILVHLFYRSIFTRRSLEIVGEHLKKHALLSAVTLFIASVGLAFGSGYWLGVLSVPSMSMETLDINEGLWCACTEVIKDDANSQWNISATLENMGRDNTTVTMVLLNGHKIPEDRLSRSPSVFGDNVTVSSLPLTIQGLTTDFSIDQPYGHTTLYSGVITVTVKYGTLDFVSGSTVEMKFRTESGLSYRILVTLP